MSEKGMFYTNVNDYETKEDIMNDFIALRMYDMQKDKEIERLRTLLNAKENIIKEAINYIKEERWFCYKDNEEVIDRTTVEKLLEILGDNDE